MLNTLLKQNINIHQMRVDEGGELSKSTDFIKLIFYNSINMQMTGGYNSWLSGKIERLHQTITHLFNAALCYSVQNLEKWCFIANLHKKFIMAYAIQLQMNNLHTHGIKFEQV